MTPDTINIVSAEQTEAFCIHLRFDDGTQQTVDFKPFLLHARHADIRAWLDAQRFSEFRIEYGELVWGDYELCFPIIDLYRNQIEHHAQLEVAA